MTITAPIDRPSSPGPSRGSASPAQPAATASPRSSSLSSTTTTGAPSLKMDDSLSFKTMHSLLKPVNPGRPRLSWSARQVKESRRRAMLKLNHWAQTELYRVERDCSEPSLQSLSLNEASRSLRGGAELCDLLMGRLTSHVAGGTSGGDDIAAEVLRDVWRVCSNVAAQNQARFWAEVKSARARATELENVLGIAQTGGAPALDANVVVQQGASGSREAEKEEEENLSSSIAAPQLDMVESEAAKVERAALAEAALRAEAMAAAAIDNLKSENAQLRLSLETAKRDLALMAQRTDALEAVAAEVADAQSRAQQAEAEREEALAQLGHLTPRPRPEHRELHALLGAAGAETALAALESRANMPPGDIAALLKEEQNPESTAPKLPHRGALAAASVSVEALAAALSRARGSTAQRYSGLETYTAILISECASLQTELAGYREAERKREAARKRREEEAQLESKNALERYLDLLGSQGEDAWKDQLIGMGQGPDVPKVFRHAGKIRNKHLSKRETEKLVKEVWKERLNDPAVVAGRAGELVEFLGVHLQKKVGIAAAVIDLGYNFLYGLWQYQWDADCELFLKSLCGQVREEVYIAQARLQSDIEELFAALDKSKGQATGIIPKEDLRIALSAFFRVGQPGGKSLERFDEAAQALDVDQPGTSVEWKKVFEEDREFNQGEFAETIRDQFLQERIEFFGQLQTALYEESGNEEECKKDQVVRAILLTDPLCTEKDAASAASGAFGPGVDVLSVKIVMKKLSRGMLRGRGDLGRSGSGSVSVSGRKSSGGARASVMVGAGGAKGRPSQTSTPSKGLPGTGKQQAEGVSRALEAVRQEWIKRQVQSVAPKKEAAGIVEGEGGGGVGADKESVHSSEKKDAS